jgi:Protein of unknown function (DUF2934)
MTTTPTANTNPTKRKTRRAKAAGISPAQAPSDASPVRPLAGAAIPRYHEDRQASIAEAAYFRAELRGFAPGHELEDWLASEEEVDQRLLGEGRAS